MNPASSKASCSSSAVFAAGQASSRRVDAAEVPAGPQWDRSHALEVVGGDPDLLKDVIEAFLQECPLLVERIGEAIVRSDTDSLRRAAHTVKSGLWNFGAEQSSELAARLEEMGRCRELKDAAETLATLRARLDRLVPELSAFDFQAGAPPASSGPSTRAGS